MTDSPILFGYGFNDKHAAIPLSGDALSAALKDDAPAWVHLDATHPDTRGWLEKETAYLDHIVLNALLADETRPRMAEVGNGILLILRGVNLNENAQPEDMVSIRLWVDPYRIISLRRRKLKAVEDMRLQLADGHPISDAGEFLSLLISRIFERMEPVLQELDEATDAIEEQVAISPDVALRLRIVEIRRMAAVLRRYISPQRDALAMLRLCELPWLSHAVKRQLQESHDRALRYVEDLDAIRERAQIVKDELANALTERLNRNLYLLSIVTVIFLPLGFLTGLLGINVGGIPGSDNPQAFWIVCAALAVIITIQTILFKWLRWF